MTASKGALDGRKALVTGATSGIGRATTLRLARAGATVMATGRDSGALDLLAKEADNLGLAVLAQPATFPNTDDVAKLVDAVRHQLGGLSILVHSAGLYQRGPLAESALAELDDLFSVNVSVPYQLTQAFLPDLGRGGGDVIFVNSTQGLQASAGVSQYAATKHALRALTDPLRAEVADAGIRVCTVYPGRTATRMQEQIIRDEGRLWNPDTLLHPDDVAEVIATAVTMRGDVALTDIMVRPARRL